MDQEDPQKVLLAVGRGAAAEMTTRNLETAMCRLKYFLAYKPPA